MGTTKRSDGKKNRNFSAECATVLPKVELEQPDSFTCSTPGGECLIYQIRIG
ncbi:hypothetical protein DPMN_170278 [Dreissena polymorpha]|uniref:Uncharacterized protein n=1 Tax=Dreissena polymorpha TaxID=45954 RepID=A0A9D4DY21_DREPO|nr:hypothetical protein DPMN_170278 [Dreissena polymorpha]